MTHESAASAGFPWAQRVGVVAARWLLTAARMRIAGIVAAACGIVLLGASLLMVQQDGESLAFALVLSFAVVAAIVTGSLFFTSAMVYWLAVDAAFDALLAPRVVESGPAPSDVAWTPGIPRPILRGVTQGGLRTLALMVLGAGILCSMGLALVGATGHFPPLDIWMRLWSLAGGILAAGALLRAAAAIRRVQEFRVGYSTVWAVLATRGALISSDLRRCVDLVDRGSGLLLRGAGQAPISRSTYMNRRNQVRAQFPHARPTRL